MISRSPHNHFMTNVTRAGRPVGSKSARHFLREWRKFRELTQDQLADLLGDNMDRTQISKIERGVTKLIEERIYQIATALRIEPGWLWMSPNDILGSEKAREFLRGYDKLSERKKTAILTLLDAIDEEIIDLLPRR